MDDTHLEPLERHGWSFIEIRSYYLASETYFNSRITGVTWANESVSWVPDAIFQMDRNPLEG
jgi:hypothetical protein